MNANPLLCSAYLCGEQTTLESLHLPSTNPLFFQQYTLPSVNFPPSNFHFRTIEDTLESSSLPLSSLIYSSSKITNIHTTQHKHTKYQTRNKHETMKALNSRVVLIDLHCSNHHVPTSTLAYLHNSNFISAVSSSFRRSGIRSARSSPEIRRPSDRFFSSNGLSLSSSSSSSSSASASTSRPEELKMFLELLPLKMRRELHRHSEIGGLIEVVMDLGRKPLARFPSGDWFISEQPIQPEDLDHAISKVIG